MTEQARYGEAETPASCRSATEPIEHKKDICQCSNYTIIINRILYWGHSFVFLALLGRKATGRTAAGGKTRRPYYINTQFIRKSWSCGSWAFENVIKHGKVLKVCLSRCPNCVTSLWTELVISLVI